MIRRLLVANRGEIAVRVIRAARELGIETVAVHSDADREALHVRLADAARSIGASHASKSYLNAEAILAAAHAAGADAVHPGYGFLAERADFAEAVEAAGLVFVGPRPDTIRMMGDKAAARAAAAAAGVPTVPGSDGVVDTEDAALAAAERVGWPLLIKAAAGGGGRGIRIATDAASLRAQLPVAQAEAHAAFGDRGVYLERLVERARHVEVQVLGDGERAIHCWERECSLQRSRQKVLEEAPSPTLTEAERHALCESAVRLARTVGYRGAGTLEYLFDDATREFFFIEMNTRIQVEHPVTEMVTGIDLVREMIRIAAGAPLAIGQHEVPLRGHAIECRINAEDPSRRFMPSPGRITALRLPGGPGVRVDGWVGVDTVVPPFYDSLLAKLVVHDADRAGAIARMRRALAELNVEGVATTRALHLAIADEPAFRDNRVHTRWLEQWLAASEGSAAVTGTAPPQS